MAGDEEGCADAGSVVEVIELVPKRLMQVNERSLGSTVVG